MYCVGSEFLCVIYIICTSKISAKDSSFFSNVSRRAAFFCPELRWPINSQGGRAVRWYIERCMQYASHFISRYHSAWTCSPPRTSTTPHSRQNIHTCTKPTLRFRFINIICTIGTLFSTTGTESASVPLVYNKTGI